LLLAVVAVADLITAQAELQAAALEVFEQVQDIL